MTHISLFDDEDYAPSNMRVALTHPEQAVINGTTINGTINAELRVSSLLTQKQDVLSSYAT